MAIWIRNHTWKIRAKLLQLGFDITSLSNFYQLKTLPELSLKHSMTKPKQKGTVFITEDDLDKLIVMQSLGLSVKEALHIVVKDKFSKE